MYAGRGETVPLPTEGHLHILKNGYVYWEDDGHWDNVRKRAMDSRRSIGKLDPTDPTRMFPNQTYRELFDPLPEPSKFAMILSYGPYAALKAAADKIGCMEVLQSVFPWQWDKMFAVAMHAICQRGDVAQDFPFWSFHNYCGLEKSLSGQEISNLYAEIAREPAKVAEFMKRFNEEYRKRVSVSDTMCIAFDSTSQSTTSNGNLLAATGHPKQNPGTPQVNTALFADEETGIPLFYEHFVGSILDKTQTPYTTEKAEMLGFEKLFVMMDRGYYSQQTAQSFTNMGLDFGVMTPEGATIARTMIDTCGDKILNNEEFYIPAENVYGINIPEVETLGSVYHTYFFYDPIRAHEERESIHAKIRFMLSKINSRKRYTQKLANMYSPWVIVEKAEKDAQGRNFQARENAAAVQTAISDAGYFVIISNAELRPEVMIHIARGRDRGEKVFEHMKSHFGITSPYTHNLETYEGKMFVAFLALIIMIAYRWLIRDVIRDMGSGTIATTLGELSRYQIMRKQSGSYMPCYAATKKQKDILGPLGITVQELEANARAVRLIV